MPLSADKVANLRIFLMEGRLNLSVQDVQGEVLVVSGYLYGDCLVGGLASAVRLLSISSELYETFAAACMPGYPCGNRRQAHMDVSLTNDRPVTLIAEFKEF